jgi:hypothetical protein
MPTRGKGAVPMINCTCATAPAHGFRGRCTGSRWPASRFSARRSARLTPPVTVLVADGSFLMADCAICLARYIGTLVELLHSRRGDQEELTHIDAGQVMLRYIMPWQVPCTFMQLQLQPVLSRQRAGGGRVGGTGGGW